MPAPITTTSYSSSKETAAAWGSLARAADARVPDAAAAPAIVAAERMKLRRVWAEEDSMVRMVSPFVFGGGAVHGGAAFVPLRFCASRRRLRCRATPPNNTGRGWGGADAK